MSLFFFFFFFSSRRRHTRLQGDWSSDVCSSDLRRLAEWGYVALLHGWKVRGANPPDAPVYDDLKGALTFLRSVSLADQRRLAGVGFCRGGGHALMAARAHEEDRVIVVFPGFALRSAPSPPRAPP